MLLCFDQSVCVCVCGCVGGELVKEEESRVKTEDLLYLEGPWLERQLKGHLELHNSENLACNAGKQLSSRTDNIWAQRPMA